MKRLLAIFLMLLFAFPAFAPWMPHDALEELHVQQEKHHGIEATANSHHGHSHQAEQSVSHSIHFDVVTYFNDYLHVDLQQANQAAWDVPSFDTHVVAFIQMAEINPPLLLPAKGSEIRGPPDWRSSRSTTPIYLTTQRLRI